MSLLRTPVSRCLPAVAFLAMALLPLQALAQVEPVAPWGFNGSDTLEEVMKDAIVKARTANVLASTGKHCVGTAVAAATCVDDTSCVAPARCVDTNTLVYLGGGSGTAETAFQTANKQALAPMSRNITQGVITANPFFAPNLRNVLGLDAAVIVTSSSASRVKNLGVPLLAGSLTVAAVNTSPATYSWSTPASGYTQILEVVLSGVDGSGSVAACADPRRIQAIQDLAAAQGTTSGTINHFYRRDDNSGTTATFQERAQVIRFCNGRARGVLGTIAGTNPNLNNQDSDPIRRPCDGLLPGLQETSCTDMTTGSVCHATDNNANCTQGLVVALSIGDSATFPDVTTSIANRVQSDPDSMGFAGREAVRLPGIATAGPAINRLPFDDTIVRSVSTPYLLARRLFLNWADTDGDPTTSATVRTLATFGGAPRVASETALYEYMTSETSNPSGRCNIDPIMKARGFLSCEPDCTTDIGSDGNNFCNATLATGYEAGFSTAPNCIPNSTNGSQWGHTQVACTAGSVCCSTGLACPTSNLCPAAVGRPVDAACSKNADCASNNCSDYRIIGTPMCAP